MGYLHLRARAETSSRSYISSSLLLLILFLSPWQISAEPIPSTPYSFRLLTGHRRPLCKVEIPVDLDMDGEDEILLWSDEKRGGHERTFVQLHSSSDNFIVGPYSPGADIQDIKVFDLDADGFREILLCTENPLILLIVSHDLDEAARYPISVSDMSGGIDARIITAFDVDGCGSRAVLLSLSPRNRSHPSRLIAVECGTGEILWTVDLQGALCGPVLSAALHQGPHFVAPIRSEEGAGLVVIDSRGVVLHRISLVDDVPADISLTLLSAPFREPNLVTLTVSENSIGAEAYLTSWQGLGPAQVHNVRLDQALSPIMVADCEGTQRLVLGTAAGDVLLLDEQLRVTSRHGVSSGPVRLAAITDLDLNGTPDIICKTNQGTTLCLSLPDGHIVTHRGGDEILVVRNGFGNPSTLVLREGNQYHYLQLTHSSGIVPGGVVFTPIGAGGLAIALFALGIAFWDVAARIRARRNAEELLAAFSLPAGLVSRKGRLLWANGCLEDLLGRGSSSGDDGNLQEMLARAGFTTAINHDDLTPPANSVRIRKGNRQFRLEMAHCCPDLLGRSARAVCIEENTESMTRDLHDAWGVAAKELTVHMRDSLSKIRLAAQWILRSRDHGDGTRPQRLELILRETAVLSDLAGKLSDAAALVDGKKEPIDPVAVLRESIRAIDSEARARISIRPDPSVRSFVGNRRQILFALQILYSPLLASKCAIDVSARSETMDSNGKEAAIIEISCFAARGLSGDQLDQLPPYAEVLAGAVAQSCEGDFTSTRDHRGNLTLRFVFAATSES